MSRTILIAGGGIAGLTAALALARKGFRAVVFEQSQKLEPIGAGIQLSPNAMHVLLGLGLGDALRPHVVSPAEIRIRKASTGNDIVRVPLGSYAQQRYGAPYWMIHRGDLQAVLLDAVRALPDVRLTLGGEVQDYVVHANGVTAQVRFEAKTGEERCVGLIGADGLWSTIRERLGYSDPPHFRKRTAWRAVIPADVVDNDAREASINLWLGRHAHLVHYPIRSGQRDQYRGHPARWHAEARLEQYRPARRNPGDLPQMGDTREQYRRGTAKLDDLDALRSTTSAPLGRWSDYHDRRCGASDATVPCPRRRHGDRGCRRAGRLPGHNAR